MEPSQTPAEDIAGLQEAFEAFNEVSGQLRSSYQSLQQQVVSLTDQLERETRRNAELATRLSALLEALPGGVIMLDEGGVVREINATACDFLGEPLQDVEWTLVCRRAFRDHTSEDGDLTLQDGRRLSLAQKPMEPGPGRVLLFTDVTEHRKLQELLDRQRRLAAMGEMAAALAHQIRTPLSAALLYATSAAGAGLTNARKDELLAKSTRCLHDLEQLIGDMLQFARGASFAEGSVELSEILTAVDTALRPLIRNGQQVRFTAPDTPARVTGNREALAGAILNLATNALQHAGDNARVTIEAQTRGLEAEIRVRDNGPGVAPDQQERIFDPFFTSRADGTGLGLAVARSVARAHGGDVQLVAEDTPGATFVVRLPLGEVSDEESSRHDEPTEDAAA